MATEAREARRESPPRVTAAELPALLARLAGDALDFVEQRFRLAEAEWSIEVRRLKSLAIGLLLALAMLILGVAFTTAGVLVLLAELGVPVWALLLGGGVALLIAAFVLVHRFARYIEQPSQMFRRTLGEIGRDKEWIRER